MNINANKESNDPILKDSWSVDKKVRNARLNIGSEMLVVQVIIVAVVFIMLLAGASLAEYSKTVLISWGAGLTDRRSEKKEIPYDMYDSAWTACAVAVLISLGISFVIFAVRYRKHAGVIDAFGIAAPLVGFFAMFANGIIQSYDNDDLFSYDGVSAGTLEGVSIDLAFVVIMFLIVVYIGIYIKTMINKSSASTVD